MNKRITLRRKIGYLCAAIAAISAILYSASLFYVLHSAESRLMASVMDDMIDNVVVYDIKHGRPPRLDSLTRLYIEGDPRYPIPQVFANLDPGYQEYTTGEDLHLYTKFIDGKRYVLTRHQGDFEVWEKRLLAIGIVFFILLVFDSGFCGWFFSRKLLSPLAALTHEAQRAERLIQNGRVYSEQIFWGTWPNNEIGDLAKSFKALVVKLKTLAIREREFSSEVSHELRTPLTVIDTSLEILEEQCADNPKQKALLRRAMNATSRMKGMTEVFLNIGRYRVGQEGALCTVSSLVERLREAWQQKAAAKGLELKIETENPSELQFNEILGASILDNLVFNSIHYTEKGQVLVRIKGESIVIKDTGIGIREEDREKIFDSGYRGAKPLHHQGFGLGLAISKKAADALGWEIHLKSEMGKGSEFRITQNPRSNQIDSD